MSEVCVRAENQDGVSPVLHAEHKVFIFTAAGGSNNHHKAVIMQIIVPSLSNKSYQPSGVKRFVYCMITEK